MLILSDEHHTVTSSTVSGPWKKKLVVQRCFFLCVCVCERYAEGSGVRNEAKLSGWMIDSQKFRKIDWVTNN